MARRWTLATLRAECLRALRRKDVRLDIRRLTKCQAQLHYVPNGPAFVTADPMQVGLINAVVHEMLHYVMDGHLDSFVGVRMKEVALDAWEERIARSIITSPDEYVLWVKAIERKLKGAP